MKNLSYALFAAALHLCLAPQYLLAQIVMSPAITGDVIYGHKAGMALTYDIVKPEKPNGAALLFMVSGGWVSMWADPKPLVTQAMVAKDRNTFGMVLDRGFTLFLVRHGSSPYFKVPDAVSDVRRAVRHIRFHAKKQGLDPDRIGVFGGSAGGHLSLMLGTTADPGNPDASDPIEKVSNRVAAVAAYFPPTDLAGYIDDKRFPALHFPADQSPSFSPLLQVSPDDAPSLLLHGGKDTLVLPSHSEKITEAFRKAGVATDLIAFPEAGHGFSGPDEKTASSALTAWFEKYLNPQAPEQAAAPAPVPVISLAGTWETKASLPDGNTRPGTLVISGENGQFKGTASGDQGERKMDRIKWENGRLLMEIDVERDGRKGLIKVSASGTSADQLTGIWSANDETGNELMSGAWTAKKKP